MDQILEDDDILRALQRRAEAMAHGDLSMLGQPVSEIASVEDLRRAIDVLGTHTEQGLRSQHAYIAALSTAQEAERARLAPQSELALFRIVQEAWNNIRRHAGARRADFTFAYEHDGLHVTISDDGVGFASPDKADAPDGHWGLRGMRERAGLTGGTVEVASEVGQGTRLHLRIPYPGEDGRDPVCGMAVEPDALGAEYAGKLYRFCSPACRGLFLAQPGVYVAPA